MLRYFAEQAGISCLQMYDIRGVRKEEPEHKCCWRVKACCSAAGADSHIDRDYNLFSLKHYKRFIKNEETGELFNSAEKIHIIDYLLETTRANGGLYLNLEEYREEGIIKDYFMLNDLETLHTLKRDWIWKLAPQPLDRIRCAAVPRCQGGGARVGSLPQARWGVLDFLDRWIALLGCRWLPSVCHWLPLVVARSRGGEVLSQCVPPRVGQRKRDSSAIAGRVETTTGRGSRSTLPSSASTPSGCSSWRCPGQRSNFRSGTGNTTTCSSPSTPSVRVWHGWVPGSACRRG